MTTKPDRQNWDGLLPCPFCGSKVAQIASNGIGDFFVICRSDDDAVYDCGARTSDVSCETRKGAIDRWNTRAIRAVRPVRDGAGEWQKDINLIRATLDRAVMATRSHLVPSQVTHALHRIEAALAAPPKPAPNAPGHTDLMVTPESVDAFMEKNPLPAPDAMREALRVISTMAVCEDGEVAENLQQIVEACRDVASEALAAPVPPADGARAMENRKITVCGSARFSDEIDRVNRHLSLKGHIVYSIVPLLHAPTVEQKEVLRAVHRAKIDASDAVYVVALGGYIGSDVAAEIEYAKAADKVILDIDEYGLAAALSPSGTGAAEPEIGEQQILDEARKRYAGHGRFQRVFAEGAGWGLRNRAAPTVRGDREAIARTLVKRRFPFRTDVEKWFTHYARCDWSNLGHVHRAAIDEAYADADAILSLPVQPGAGERE